MAKQNHELLAFNRGIVSPKLMSRIDVPRVALSAEVQTNFMPSTLGAMSLRPGLQYIGETRNNLAAKHIPFIYSNSDTAILELTNTRLRIRTAGVLLTRPAVTTAITNGDFTIDLAGWTDLDAGSSASTGLAGGYMQLFGDGGTAAIREQLVTVGTPGVEHALKVVVERGPVTLSVGTTSGGDDLVTEITLATGWHSIAFTPATNFYVRFSSFEEYPVLLNSCTLEAAGVVEFPTLWTTEALPFIRSTQSGDVVFVACTGYPVQRIERLSARSWSAVEYIATKGPFRAENTTLTAVAANVLSSRESLDGLVTLTATRRLFNSGYAGSLFSSRSKGQRVYQRASTENVWSDTIKVEGSGSFRNFSLNITGTWAGTVTLQRSVGVLGSWQDVSNYIANTFVPSINDALDNQIAYYRLGIRPGSYSSGTATLSMTHEGGSITGIARILYVNNAYNAVAYILKDFGGYTPTDTWAEGAWSSYRGYPSCVAISDGRLWLAGRDRIWASVVDDYNNHDASYLGDAGPISRSIGEGPVATINWAQNLAGQQLILGADADEFSIKSSNRGEPITPFNFSVRPFTSRGSYNVDAERLDTTIVFVDASGNRLIELTQEGAVELNILAPHILQPYAVDLAVQRRPDSRIHCVRQDGKVAVLVTSQTEDVRAWITIETDGFVEEAFTLPGLEEDDVYYVVRRAVGASTFRFLEKFAKASECVGGQVNKQADSFVHYNGAPTATITGLSHLNFNVVAVWADGVDRGSFTVTGGSITLPAPMVSQAVVGRVYTAQFKSTKLAQSGVALISRKRISHIGVLLTDTHAKGLKYGPDFTLLDDMPEVEAGEVISPTGIWSGYNYDHVEFNGSYTVDSRLCLQAQAPRPCTVLAAVIEMDV